MNRSFEGRERRRHPRCFIELPLEYREVTETRGLGGMVRNASETGFLIESVKDIPIGTKLWISVLFPKEFELADFEVEATIEKEPPGTCPVCGTKGFMFKKID